MIRPQKRTNKVFNITKKRKRKQNYSTGTFIPKNPEKYIGKKLPEWRSSWENTVMNKFDSHVDVKYWGSEIYDISYQDPTTMKWRTYIPDFYVVYVDRDGVEHKDIIEIKPKCQTYEDLAKTKRDKEAYKLNQAKWAAAKEWCAINGVGFRILTEEDIYRL